MHAIKQHLEAMRDLQAKLRPPGTPFHGISLENFLLQHGRPFETSPATFKGRRGKRKGCYMNAGRATLDHGLPYVEGLVDFSGIPIAHAWNLDPEGRVLDPTLRAPGLEKVRGYFGVPFSKEYLRETILERRFWGIFPEIGDQRFLALLKGERPDALALELVQKDPILEGPGLPGLKGTNYETEQS